MTVGVESEVEVFIGVGGVAPPTPTDSTNPPTTVVRAELACFIELNLSGTGFEIETPVQSGDFTSAETGRWFWDVTPERPGRLDLELRIVPKLSTAAGFQHGTPRTFTKLIAVEAVPRTVWQQVGDVSGGVAAHPLVQIALAAGFVGGASSFAKRQLAKWRARREPIVDEGDGYLWTLVVGSTTGPQSSPLLHQAVATIVVVLSRPLAWNRVQGETVNCAPNRPRQPSGR